MWAAAAIPKKSTLPGFRHNVCSVVHTNIPISPVYRDLELERHGVRYVYPEYLRGTIFPDHTSIVMFREPERMAAELAAFRRATPGPTRSWSRTTVSSSIRPTCR